MEQSQMANVGAYTHAHPDGSVFYVGKGTEKRARLLKGRNQHHANIVRKYGVENIIVGWVECESEEQAFGLEKHLIATCKEIGIKLCNQTDGGEGMSNPSEETRAKLSDARKGKIVGVETRAKISVASKGKIISAETRIKMSDARKGKILGAETRAKLSAASKGRKHPPRSDECRAKLSAASKGKQYHLGHKHSQESIAKMSKPRSEIGRANMSISHIGKVHDAETKEKIGNALRGKLKSEEARANMKAAQNKSETKAKLSASITKWWQQRKAQI
jgi:predicted GIY-YIG superfamily endonuclease